MKEFSEVFEESLLLTYKLKRLHIYEQVFQSRPYIMNKTFMLTKKRN